MNSTISNSNIKKYTLGILLFLFFVFLFDRGLFFLLQYLEEQYYTPNQFEATFSRYVGDKNYSTLIFGTSRTYEGIHPKYLKMHLGQEAFKESFQGKGPRYNYYFYKMYKKYAGVPRVVIYGVDYFIYTVKSDPRWMVRFDVSKEEEDNETGLFSSPLLLLKNKRQIDTFSKNVLIGAGEIVATDEEQDEKDIKELERIQGYTGVNDPKKKLVTKPFRNYLRQRYPRPPGMEGKYFKKLLKLLARDKVTVIFVGLPDYFGSYKTNIERQKFLMHLKRLCRKYKNIYLYNYNKPKKFELSNVSYFNDGGYGMTNSHLSQTGARIFNKLLCDDIKHHYKEKK
jgi:hypothetical protein